jgi:hypothetical protein
VNSLSGSWAGLRPNHRSIVEGSDSSDKLFDQLACPAFKQCRCVGSWPFRTLRVAPRLPLLNGRVFRTAGTAQVCREEVRKGDQIESCSSLVSH